MDRRADNDRPEVERAGDSGHHNRQAERLPLYAPVRYTFPSIQNGWEPAPAATRVVPIWLAEEHVPWAACGSSHSGTLFKTPSRPGGVLTVNPERLCSRS